MGSVRDPTAARHAFDATARERLARAAERVFRPERDVVAVYLYGSAARGERPHDLDVGVLFADAPDPRVLEPLAAKLQAEGAPNGPEIDLRPMNNADPRFLAMVLNEREILFERSPRARWEREARMMSAWADFKPTWDRMRRCMLERWQRG